MGPVIGRVDRDCRLISADQPLEALQREAGSRIGAELALPQIAAIARLALKLGVPLSRPAVVAGADRDVELWVRAQPQGEEVELELERWVDRPAAPSRLTTIVSADRQGSASAERQWTTDRELRVCSIGAALARQLGCQPADAQGQPLTLLFKLEEDEEGRMPLLEGVTARAEFAGQRARLRGGDEAVFLLQGKPAHDSGGDFAGYSGSAVPLSDEAGDENAALLSDIDAALDEALRSPLDRIIESADRIVQQSDGPLRSDYADYASDIAAAARHLLSVVRSMRGEDDRRDLIDLARLADDAAAMLESSAREREVRIEVQAGHPLMAQGDSRGVIQILVNLIGNAVRHSPNGGTVSVVPERAADGARVHVVDQGPGIDPADQQRIFERFEQGRPGEGGAGLGLTIARRLARSMGGDVSVESTPGAGARFTLILPPE